jgi:hypothetical protein
MRHGLGPFTVEMPMEAADSRPRSMRSRQGTDAEWGGDPGSRVDAGHRRRAAEQITIEASRLQSLALAHDHPFLAYLIEMVVLEAWREASGEPLSDEDQESLAGSLNP